MKAMLVAEEKRVDSMLRGAAVVKLSAAAAAAVIVAATVDGSGLGRGSRAGD